LDYRLSKESGQENKKEGLTPLLESPPRVI
jgi:hypothetical protein